MEARDIIIRPLITEKSTTLMAEEIGRAHV